MSIGERVRRADAPDKARGVAHYVRDRPVSGALDSGVFRSPHPHARVKKLDVSAVRAVPGVRAVLTASDIPGSGVIPMVQGDWPALAREFVRHVGEPLAVVAAETPAAVAAALAAIEVEYEPLVATLDMDQALASGEIIAHYKIRRGEAAVALGRSEIVVVEDEVRLPGLAYAALEGNGVIAQVDGRGGLLVEGPMESPFLVRSAVSAATGLDLSHVRVVQTVTGGGFGSKEEGAILVAVHASLLAVATGRPVRMFSSREQEGLATARAHPGRVKIRMGATPEGHLIGAEVDVLMDGGAYATLTPVVLSQGLTHACGPYRVPNVRVDARAVRTHKRPSGSLRGSGALPVALACEIQMDALAGKLGLDPLEFRRKNALRPGDLTITGQRLESSVGLPELLTRVEEESEWTAKRLLFGRDSGVVRRGIGIASGYCGIGLGPLGRQLHPGAGADVVVSTDGSVTVCVGATDTGQGEATALAQLAANSLGCPVDLVRLVETDTSRVPDGGPALGSRATTSAGAAIQDAAKRIRLAIEEAGGDVDRPWMDVVAFCAQKHLGLAAHGWASSPEASLDLATGQGDPYPAYTFSVVAAEVEVNISTGETRVVRVTSGHDVGRVLNPTTAEALVEGGVAFGVGLALLEELRVEVPGREGGPERGYEIPGAVDLGDVQSVFVEHPFPQGPAGAKGLADASVIPVAPAILAAISHATGARLREVPATPERVFEALRQMLGSRG